MKKFRKGGNDPFYNSTETWKTAKQWHALGYRFRANWKDDALDRALIGYRSAYCTEVIVRYHRSAMQYRGKPKNKK